MSKVNNTCGDCAFFRQGITFGICGKKNLIVYDDDEACAQIKRKEDKK